MDINFEPSLLIENKLTISEFLYLKYLNGEEIPKLFHFLDPVDDLNLQEKGFIKISENGPVLRKKGRDLFQKDSLFLRFLNTFPIKTPSGRYLSPLGPEGKLVKEVRKKWDKHFKGRPELEFRAVQVLEAELDWRKKTGKMEYIHNIDTWLNQSDYEKYLYLVEEFEKGNTKNLM